MEKYKYYVINLKRRPDRFESFKKNYPLDISKIDKVEAIDGRTLTNIPDNFKYLNVGEIGCFLSHKLIWEKTFFDKDSNYSIIFEDDAIFSENFAKNFNEIINTNIDFDILFVGGRFTNNYKMINCIKVTDKIVKYNYNKEWELIDCNRTTHAYIVSKKCCELLLKYFYKILKNNNINIIKFAPVDHFIMHVLRLNKIDIYHSFPLLCHSPLVGDSDIR